jgi:hypothetical protein
VAAEELEAGVDPPTDVGTLEVLAGASLVALVEARVVDPACSQPWSASPRSRGTDRRARGKTDSATVGNSTARQLNCA